MGRERYKNKPKSDKILLKTVSRKNSIKNKN